jgi:hypothetical protein
LERFWHWVHAHEAVASEPVRTVDQWRAQCVVKPWVSGCKTTRRANAAARARLSPAGHPLQRHTSPRGEL